VRGALRRAAKTAAGVADRVRPPGRGVVVLAYHRVGGGSHLEIDLPTTAFDAQMGQLARSGRAVALDEALALLAGPPPRDEDRADPVVVTFDDGTADFVEHALPVLVRHRVPATVYVATEHVECQRPFPHDGPPLTWTALAEAVATGLVTVGSHTHTHALLDQLDEAGAARELDTSIDLIAEHLGVVPVHFAYPKAVAGSPGAVAAVRTRFTSAALAGTRPNRYGATDPHELARSPIQRSDGTRWFAAKVAGGLGLEDRARQMLDRRRYAGVTT